MPMCCPALCALRVGGRMKDLQAPSSLHHFRGGPLLQQPKTVNAQVANINRVPPVTWRTPAVPAVNHFDIVQSLVA